MFRVGCDHGERSLMQDGFRGPVMDACRREHCNPAVPMMMIIPVKERSTEIPGILNGAKTFGEVGTVFERLERCLGVRVVVGDMRP